MLRLAKKSYESSGRPRPYLSHDLASEVAFMEARGTSNPFNDGEGASDAGAGGRRKPYGVIAEHLHVSYKTVKTNTCTQLKAKLGVRTLPELMRIATSIFRRWR